MPAGLHFSQPVCQALPPELVARLSGAEPPAADDIRAACVLLREELAAIARFVPALVVQQQLDQPHAGAIRGDYWDGTVLFADLSGFTAMSGQLSVLGKQGAEDVSAIINNLFAALVDEIHRYAGVLLKFGGDALTAFFDAQLLGRDHAGLAARAALAMQERMNADFGDIQTRAGTFPLRLRVGVHSGRVFAAEVGDQSHIELVVTGRNINRVATAQEIADPGEVVVSRDTLVLLPSARASRRDSQFSLLESSPAVLPSSRLRYSGWPHGAGDIGELQALADRIDALRPYLPHLLPRRFLESTADNVELGEFRPVTVLFANFAPFSRALPLLGNDVAAAAQVLNAYYQRVQAVVHRYGGIVNKVDMYTHGDKVLALFGAPVAHEDDPLRAVRCALELRDVLAETNREIRSLLHPAAGRLIQIGDAFLEQRIGINTGVVFAGRVGSAQRHEYTVMGQPVNIAARLMAVAAPGAIVLSPSTRRAVAGRIAVREREPVSLKGIDGPLAIVEAIRVQEAVNNDRTGLGRAELVGRSAELDRMLAAARLALAGDGRVVSIIGEAGVGKSRLAGELLERLFGEAGLGLSHLPSFMMYVAECQSYEQNTAYAVARQLLSQLLMLVEGMPQVEQRIIQRVHELAPDLARFAPLLGDVLAMPLAETALSGGLPPEVRHERVLDLVEALVRGAARAQPLVLIVDDMHWSDASSLELLERIARAAAHTAVLLIFNYRNDPPLAAAWREYEHALTIELDELSPAASATLVRSLLRGEPPPELERRLERAQGNPFFIEAVTRSLIESGTLVQQNGAWHLAHRLDDADIPDSIEGVITARLDRLEESLRETLQVAAVIGRRFAYSVLNGLIQPPDVLPTRLERLEASDLVTPDSEGREANARYAYQFVHALTRDVAYEGILYARRRDLHLRVAQRIEALYGERADEQLSLLAGHYLLAEAWPKAFEYHVRAGRRAQERFANREAIALFERALEIAERNESPQPADMLLVELHERMGAIQALIGEYDQALTRFGLALAQLQQQHAPPLEDLLRLHHHVARVYEKRANFDTAFDWVERAIALAGAQQTPFMSRCLLLGAGIHQRQGRYALALEWGERARLLAETFGSERDQAAALLLLGGTYRNLGDNNRAFELTDHSLQLYRRVQELGRLADAHNNLANICFELGRLADARMHYEAGAEIKRAIGDVYGEGLIACNLGELFRLQGETAEAIDQYAQALAIYERLGSDYMAGVLHMNLGAAHLVGNDTLSAASHLQASAELFARAGAEDFLPELERNAAELELRRGNAGQAHRLCEQALATAARLEARAEEGLTRRLMAEILLAEGNPHGAWVELGQSQSILRDADSPHEIARTLLAIADLALLLGQQQIGASALAEATQAFSDLGARHDLERAQQLAARYDGT